VAAVTLAAVALAAAMTVAGETAAATLAVVAAAAATSVAAAVSAATLATVAVAAVVAAVEALAAEARPRGLRYAFVAWTLPSRLGFARLALATHATRSRLGLHPCGLALPTHNNQTAKQRRKKVLRQCYHLSAPAVAAGRSSSASSRATLTSRRGV
jgi:hypothetical protein